MLNTVESKAQAMDKLNALVSKGRQSATQVIDHVMQNQPVDRIIRGSAILFKPDPTRNGIVAEVPVMQGAVLEFLDSLAEEKAAWGKELLAHNMNKIFHERF